MLLHLQLVYVVEDSRAKSVALHVHYSGGTISVHKENICDKFCDDDGIKAGCANKRPLLFKRRIELSIIKKNLYFKYDLFPFVYLTYVCVCSRKILQGVSVGPTVGKR